MLSLFLPLSASGKCSKEEVCEMTKKMNPFAVLEQCPESYQIISKCRNISRLKINDLPKPKFVNYKDGTVGDVNNNLLWMQTEIPNKKKNFNDAIRFANSYSIGNQSNWRLPTFSVNYQSCLEVF